MRAQPGRGNRLLHLFSAAALEELAPLVPVQLGSREPLHEPGDRAHYVYFPVTTVISLVSTMESGASAEVAVVGREGMIGLAGVLSGGESPTAALVQIPGLALRATTAAVRTARARHASVRQTIDAYLQARFIQVAQAAACNRLHRVEARLARWLLELHDRIDGDEFLVSQEFIADMLGVHRPTVSTTLQDLQKQQALTRRGRAIVITDREALERRACECYGLVDRELERLLTPVPAQLPGTPASAAALPPAETEAIAAVEALRQIAGRLLVVSLREQEAREQAEAANRAKDQFLAMMSHELRSPLTAILGWCSALERHEYSEPEHGIAVIVRNAQAQLKLVDDLLDATRVSSATLSVHAAPVNLPALVSDAVETVRAEADAKHVALAVAPAAALPDVMGDADRLRQVLLNVLSNSLTLTLPGGTIDVGFDLRNGHVRVTVHDSGQGLDPGALPHAVDRAHVAPAREAGPGLGLAIARALVELHGGSITLDSGDHDRGTTCIIALPIAAARPVGLAPPP